MPAMGCKVPPPTNGLSIATSAPNRATRTGGRVASCRTTPIDAQLCAWQSGVAHSPTRVTTRNAVALAMHSVWFRWPQCRREGARQQPRPRQARSASLPEDYDAKQRSHQGGSPRRRIHVKRGFELIAARRGCNARIDAQRLGSQSMFVERAETYTAGGAIFETLSLDLAGSVKGH